MATARLNRIYMASCHVNTGKDALFKNPGTPPYKRGGTVTGKTQKFHGLSARKMGSVVIATQHGSTRAPKTNQHHKSKQNGSKLGCTSRAILCKQTPSESLQAYPLYSWDTLQPTLFGAKTGPYIDASYMYRKKLAGR